MTTKAATVQSNIADKLNAVGKSIGRTPLLEIGKVGKVAVYAKAEWKQLGGSIKSRAAFAIIRSALASGQLTGGKILLDASSGNTGISYAIIGKQIGIEVCIVLPENASKERKDILRSLDVNLVFTSRFGSTDEAQEKAKEIALEYPEKYFYADQYANDANWEAHRNTTAVEILKQTSGGLTHFICGLGTTGTFMGTTRGFKELAPHVRTVALQPETALHGLEGWKHLETAKFPPIYHPELVSECRTVSTLEAYDMMKRMKRDKNLDLSPSSAANIAGALSLANSVSEGTIVTVLPDNADKYSDLLTQLFKTR